MQYKYDISIIIPVYNNEKYIDECLKSILNQKFDINRIQIILINDGSIDNSFKVMKKYESKNIIVINKENTGVSDTRNIGMKKAQGKYIMFLDSDDYLSNNACNNIFNLFEKNYDEIDLITYPIVYKVNKEFKKHPRYSKLFYKGTGVYDLTKDYNLIQATINICVKNKFENNNLFDINQNFSEDERFATEILMNKKKIGFCKEATYYYRRHVGTANDTITNPFYSFEMVLSYYEYLFKKFSVDGKVPKYIQTLYLNNLSWRIRQDVLYPYHYDKENYNKAVKRIKKLLDKIDVDVILSLPYSRFHQVYILKNKEEKINININDNKYQVTCNDIVIEEDSSILVPISRLKIKNDIIKLNGRLATVLYEVEEPKVFIKTINKNNKIEIQKIDTFEVNNSYYLSTMKTNNIYGFELNINMKNLKKFELYAEVDNTKIPITFKFSRFTSNVNYYKNKRIYSNLKKFKISYNNVFYKIKDSLKNLIKYSLKNPKIVVCRLLGKTYIKRKKIWLYNDKGGLVDNAYYQFKHDILKNDGIKRFYVYNESFDKIKDKFSKKEQKYLVKYKSLKHIKLFLRSDKILTSFSDLQVYCPLNNGIKWYRDIIKYDLIYLQHGILHANLVKMYSKEFTEIDKFVISTNFEKNNLINKYHYNENDLIKTGMPRMKDSKIINPKDKILFAPSWRKYLIGNLVNNKRALKKKQFVNSTFYKEIYDFLHSKELNKYLKDNKLTLDFKLHPIFKEYGNLFDLKDLENINLNFDKTNIYEYKLFITDFSSFQFDFVKLQRPIIYFVPDIKEFKAGLHTYRELDLKYEDAFGKLCLTSKELLNEMKHINDNKYKVEKEYLDRMKTFFLNIKNPTEDIYLELMK